MSKTIGESHANCLTWDSIQDSLVDEIVAKIVILNEEACIASVDTCHIPVIGTLVCLEHGRELGEASGPVSLEHVLELCHGHLSTSSDCSFQFRALLSADYLAEGCNLIGPVWAPLRIDVVLIEEGQASVEEFDGIRDTELRKIHAELLAVVRVPVTIVLAGRRIPLAIFRCSLPIGGS